MSCSSARSRLLRRLAGLRSAAIFEGRYDRQVFDSGRQQIDVFEMNDLAIGHIREDPVSWWPARRALEIGGGRGVFTQVYDLPVYQIFSHGSPPSRDGDAERTTPTRP